MQGNVIELNTKVDINSLNSIHTGEDIAFTKKNTRPYQELLSNYIKKSGDGWITTNGSVLSLKSVTDNIATFKDDSGIEYNSDATYVLKDVDNLTIPVSGDIESLEIYDGIYAVIVKDKSNSFFYCTYDIEQKEWTDTHKISGSVESAFIIYNSTEYGVVYEGSNDISIYYSSHSLKVKLSDSSIGAKANNGAYITTSFGDCYVIGRSDDNQNNAWSIRYIISSHTYNSCKFLGCVSHKGYVTGEPFPCGTAGYPSYKTYTVLDNGVIKWTIDHTDLATAVSANYSSLGSIDKTIPSTAENLNSATKDYTYTLRSMSRDTYCWCYALDPYSLSTNFRTITTADTYYGTIDPNATPGNFWSQTSASIDQYDNVFPYMYLFTNVASNKGKIFDYGDGWARLYFSNKRVDQTTVTMSHKLTIPVVYTAPLLFITWNDTDKTATSYTLENTTTNTSTYTSGSYKVDVSPILDSSDNHTLAISTATVMNAGYRAHPITYTMSQNKAWPDFLYQIGGTNSGQYGLADVLPFTINSSNDSNICYQYYNNLLMSASYNKVLLNTASQGVEHWTDYVNDDDIYVALDKTIYHINKGTHTVDDITVRKIADYNFATNILGEANLFTETRDGRININRSFIPYNNAHVFSTAIKTSGYYAPEDGGATNDVWFSAAGVNTNMDDKYTSASYLLPSIEIPIYVYSENLSEFNRKIIDGSNPILTPDVSDTLFDDEEAEAYYTHTLTSTDITYKFTIKGTDIYFDSDYTDNTWWITADTVIFPIGIGSDLSGINYIAPTVDLGTNYAARLYTKDNQVFMVINNASQIFYGSTIFTIYTSSYYYDGQGIYYVGGTNTNTANTFACYAIGMKFLGNSPTEAYFYSDYDKSIYTFTGSATLNKTTKCAQLNGIKDTMFSSVDQTLYLLDNSNQLFFMDAETSALIKCTDDIDHLEGTVNGCALIKENGWEIYSPYGDGELLPFEIETEWLGTPIGLSRVTSFEAFIYNNNVTKPINVKSYVYTMIDNKPNTEVHNITIYPKDFKDSVYRLPVTPSNTVGDAFKFGIYCEDAISISHLVVYMDSVSEKPGTRR